MGLDGEPIPVEHRIHLEVWEIEPLGQLPGHRRFPGAAAANDDPYVFIMEANGKLLVHPSLVGQNLKDKAGPVYDEVAKGTAAGDYVRYQWGGANKCTYSRKTKSGLIVGCGYNE